MTGASAPSEYLINKCYHYRSNSSLYLVIPYTSHATPWFSLVLALRNQLAVDSVNRTHAPMHTCTLRGNCDRDPACDITVLGEALQAVVARPCSCVVQAQRRYRLRPPTPCSAQHLPAQVLWCTSMAFLCRWAWRRPMPQLRRKTPGTCM